MANISEYRINIYPLFEILLCVLLIGQKMAQSRIHPLFGGAETEIGGKSTGTDCINSFQSVSITKLQHVKCPTWLILTGRAQPKSIRGSDIATINCLR